MVLETIALIVALVLALTGFYLIGRATIGLLARGLVVVVGLIVVLSMLGALLFLI